ncbi:protein involved in sex pheromone biosynthesis [Evansella vedderi]|uniref:Protein involved in sex pheromone biosynthesis n=1 Tax=Evansella vedderi TaxID=38282 RepID=A0ABT9ZS59_9BACI|nr:CamS family sex pheromone protein [Evansella vedderi]MDQ0254054.1 protein involved in sex pheromone biosynthesis [Evansella vedderi]
MKLKISLIVGSFLLLLSGCIPVLDRGEEEDIIIVEETEDSEEQHYVITPTIDTPENFYRNVLNEGRYNRSPARGNVADAMNNRIDINQFELGLMEIATAHFPQSDYYFQEGQFLTGDTINSWLRRYDSSETRYMYGLNPPLGEGETDEERMRSNPLILSNVMEHNYWYGSEEEGVNLGGVVIGLALRSVYYFRTEDEEGRYHFHEEPLDLEMVEREGRAMAQEVVSRLRNDERIGDTPITIALFQEQRRGSIVPGSFIAMAELGEGQTTIQNWEPINEQFVFFPSNQGRNTDPNLSNTFSQFRTDVEEFFGRTIGIVGKGRYKNDSLDELTIEFNMQSHGKAEIIALTQFVSGRLNSMFDQIQAPIYVYFNSINGPESLIVRHPDREPYIHIYK